VAKDYQPDSAYSIPLGIWLPPISGRCYAFLILEAPMRTLFVFLVLFFGSLWAGWKPARRVT
jgi:hypothetical protein